MKIKKIYNSILQKENVWNYYNKDLKAPNILDTKDCKRFIKEFINYSEKSKTILFDDIDSLFKNYPNRFYHIVSAFFLGLWLFNHKKSKFLRDSIIDELTNLKCFKDECKTKSKEIQDLHDKCQRLTIEKQFTFVWFMATLFHDLGYLAEMEKEERKLPNPNYKIPSIEKKSVPDFYADVFKNYYEYRENKEHGIYAGLNFDENICDIRRFQCTNLQTDLDWKEELEELYHYVAWIILSHNIWMIRDDDKNINVYKENYLNELILSSEKDEKGQYKEYKISFDEFPLFTFFCIIDTIEPLKSTSCLSKVDIQLKGKKIIIKSNDSVYRKKILELNEWLLPVSKENDDMITINLTITKKNNNIGISIPHFQF